jgi:hypothetical protein
MVRLKASAARRFPFGVWTPLPGAEPCRRQRFLGRPSSSAAQSIRQGIPVERACAKHRGHHRLRVPTITYPHDTRKALSRPRFFSLPPRRVRFSQFPWAALSRTRLSARTLTAAQLDAREQPTFGVVARRQSPVKSHLIEVRRLLDLLMDPNATSAEILPPTENKFRGKSLCSLKKQQSELRRLG